MNVLEKYLKGNLVFIICYKKTDIIALLPLIKKEVSMDLFTILYHFLEVTEELFQIIF